MGRSFIIAFIALHLLACGSENPYGQVPIKIRLGPFEDYRALTAPTSAAGFDCLAINVVSEQISSADEVRFPSSQYQGMSGSSDTCFYPGVTSELIALDSAAPKEVTLTLPKGDSLIQVLGIHGVDACSSTNLGTLLANSVHPHQEYAQIYELGRTTVNINTSTTISIPNNYDPDDLQEANCYTPDSLTLSVEAVYSGATNWMDYWDPENNMTCTPETSSRCVHGGEAKKIVLDDYDSCKGLKAQDDLGIFKWRCEVKNGKAHMLSAGFRPDRGLRHLVDSSGFYSNRVVVKIFEKEIGVTPESVWWGNTISPITTGTANIITLSSSGTIYVTGGSGVQQTEGYHINADKIGVVVLEDDQLEYNGSVTNRCESATGGVTSPDTKCMITVESTNFHWLEGEFNGKPGAGAQALQMIYIFGSKFSRLHALKAKSALDHGIVLKSSDQNHLTHIVSANHQDNGLLLDDSDRNRILGLSVYNNPSSPGLEVTNGSMDNIFTQVVVSNIGTNAVEISSNNNLIAYLLSANSSAQGISYSTGADTTTLIGAVSVNHFFKGLLMNAGNNHKTYDFVATNNASNAVQNTTGQSGLLFKGSLLLGNNGAVNCNMFTGSNLDAGMSATCSNSDPEVEVVSTANSASSFVGIVSDDDKNLHDATLTAFAGLVIHANISDWLNFSSPFRTWGKYSSSGPLTSTHRGACTSETCAAWEWAGRINDVGDPRNGGQPMFINNKPCPTSEDTITHDFSSGSMTFLRYAIEISDDRLGNDNGLCESNEDCLYAPNFGPYQGHGLLEESTCSPLDNSGTVKNVSFYEYSDNGF